MSEYTDIKHKTYKIIQRVREENKTNVDSERDIEKAIVEELYKIFLVEAKVQ